MNQFPEWLDCIGRPLFADDYVFHYSNVYVVLEKLKHGRLKLMLANPSATTRPKKAYANQCALLDKLWAKEYHESLQEEQE